MASHHPRRNTNKKGAAEELELPHPPSYDPTQYQRPHPDDRKTQHKGEPPKTGAKASPTAKDNPTTDKGNGKDPPPPDLCGWCEKLGAKLRCSQCKLEVYCDRECQRVSGTQLGDGSSGLG